jgi:plastocyanin
MAHRLTAAVFGAAAALALGAPAGAHAQTFTVEVGPPGRLPAHLDTDAFFPSTLTVHAGDAVRFQIHGVHDVAYVPRGMAAPPFVIAARGSTAGDLRDAAGAPFWFDSAPRLELNPAVARPAGGRTLDPARYFNSGLPSRAHPTASYRLRFTRLGTFRFLCLVHRGMSAVVRVVPRERAIASAAAVRARARAQLRSAVRRAARLEQVTPGRLTVLAGHDAGPVAWMRFFPQHLRVRAGQTVTFRIDSKREAHTFTFGPESYTGEIERTLIEPQPRAGGAPTLIFNPLGAYASEPPGSGLTYTGTNHGNRFLNSGLLDTDPHTPNPARVRIRFTQPGTYHYECVIHPDMDGTIRVTR